MGPEHASGAAPPDQRRCGLDRRIAVVCAAARLQRAQGAGVRRARRRHDRLSSRRVRDRGAAQPAVRRDRSATTRCWNAESQIQLREYGTERMHGCDLTAGALRPGRRGARRPRRVGRTRRRSARRDRARAGEREAGLRQRDDREHRGAGDPAVARVGKARSACPPKSDRLTNEEWWASLALSPPYVHPVSPTCRR